MPKSQFIDQKTVRQSGWIKYQDTPVNQYNLTIEEEKKLYTKDDFLRIYRDMKMIREFEMMLNSIKTTSSYNGIEYSHPGPAHLSIGQEASAVGQAYLLDTNDWIFGSHRSHGEIIAKGLSAIEKLSDKELMEIMENYFEGSILKIVQKDQKTVKELAIDFLMYGTLAEIFARETGFHKGLGGSMHAFFCPFGIYPNNAIVGGSATIATGSASRSLTKRYAPPGQITMAGLLRFGISFPGYSCNHARTFPSFTPSGINSKIFIPFLLSYNQYGSALK